jgi:hypothetical protein
MSCKIELKITHLQNKILQLEISDITEYCNPISDFLENFLTETTNTDYDDYGIIIKNNNIPKLLKELLNYIIKDNFEVNFSSDYKKIELISENYDLSNTLSINLQNLIKLEHRCNLRKATHTINDKYIIKLSKINIEYLFEFLFNCQNIYNSILVEDLYKEEWYEKYFKVLGEDHINQFIVDKRYRLYSKISTNKFDLINIFINLLDEYNETLARYYVGDFSLFSLSELKDYNNKKNKEYENKLKFKIISDIKSTIEALNIDNIEKIVIQASSQFNLREKSDEVTDEEMTNYYKNLTPGRKVALLSPIGTLFRNYFLKGRYFDYSEDYSEDDINTLQELIDLEIITEESNNNGYITAYSNIEKETDLQECVDELLKVGIQWNSPWFADSKYKLCQVYCSALSIEDEAAEHDDELESESKDRNALSAEDVAAGGAAAGGAAAGGAAAGSDATGISSFDKQSLESNASDLEPSLEKSTVEETSTNMPKKIKLAKAILRTAYKLTLEVGVSKISTSNPNPIVYLTVLNRGDTKDEHGRIADAIKEALDEYKDYPLDVRLFSDNINKHMEIYKDRLKDKITTTSLKKKYHKYKMKYLKFKNNEN